jgi:prepilin-type N-terminal cleavage/methylation domain-containing protein
MHLSYNINMKKGFTLIELLIVIAIVSLISSITFYNMTEARKKAEDSHMKQESSQVRKAIELYKIDNEGKVPYAGVKGVMVRENDDRLEYENAYQNAMNLLVPQYLPEVPTSPDGESYAYFVSEDETEAVFAVSLNYESSSSRSKNSCNLVNTNPVNCYIGVARFRQLPGQSGSGKCLLGPDHPYDLEISFPSTNFCSVYNQDGNYPEICNCVDGEESSFGCVRSNCDQYGGFISYETTGQETFEPSPGVVLQCSDFTSIFLQEPYGAVCCDFSESVICDGSSNHDHCECI